MSQDPSQNAFAELDSLAAELWLREDPNLRARLWGKVQIALMRLGVEGTKVAKVVNADDAQQLKDLIDFARANAASQSHFPSVADGRTIAQARAEKAAAAGYDSLEDDNLKRALKQFRKKLKALRRDDESRLTNRALTTGKPSAISAITPPTEYPRPVWDKLVELGRLQRAGQGTYQLPPGSPGA